ncbi:hypothetical protein KIL84_020764 [Mauremys mutica]|uniref:Uncharacterized protein n=1 Tax=Mauremys mutica TaxID=74926 RepID=A0A9D3XBL9_9SAUR|nr:hypothetical protein KIL84_020764 [Mauremys mutica]
MGLLSLAATGRGWAKPKERLLSLPAPSLTTCCTAEQLTGNLGCRSVALQGRDTARDNSRAITPLATPGHCSALVQRVCRTEPARGDRRVIGNHCHPADLRGGDKPGSLAAPVVSAVGDYELWPATSGCDGQFGCEARLDLPKVPSPPA